MRAAREVLLFSSFNQIIFLFCGGLVEDRVVNLKLSNREVNTSLTPRQSTFASPYNSRGSLTKEGYLLLKTFILYLYM